MNHSGQFSDDSNRNCPWVGVSAFLGKDIFYTLVIDWAVLGILLKRTAVGGSEGQGVVVAAIVGVCILSLGILVQVFRRKIYR